jgi:hypothetical protein
VLFFSIGPPQPTILDLHLRPGKKAKDRRRAELKEFYDPVNWVHILRDYRAGQLPSKDVNQQRLL